MMDALPPEWKWEDRIDPTSQFAKNVWVLVGQYEHNFGYYATVFMHTDGWYYARRDRSVKRWEENTIHPDDIKCHTLDEAKAAAYARIRLTA